MTRSFGDKIVKPYGVTSKPDIMSYELKRSNGSVQYIILASDGVWDVLSEKEIALLIEVAPPTFGAE